MYRTEGKTVYQYQEKHCLKPQVRASREIR